MRILFAFAGKEGHFDPLIPIARAVQAAGHHVAIAAMAAMAPTIEAAGFLALAAEIGWPDSSERTPISAEHIEHPDDRMRKGFVELGGRERVPPLLALCREWHPDLIVCDEMDFGSMIAAERLGLPHATVLVIATGSFVRPAVLAEALDELRAEHGLPSDPDLAMLSRYLVFSPFPPSFRDPAYPLPSTAHALRPTALEPAHGESAPLWLSQLHDAPTVYVTLGTVFNMWSGDLFERVLAGLRDLHVNVVVTVGRHIDPAQFGPQPDYVHIERYIPQSLILPHCSMVVSHGGSGSVIGALAYGLPQVVIPLGADMPLNGARVAALGLGQVLDARQATPESVRVAAATVLAHPAYRLAAERFKEECASLPEPTHAVPLLERLAAEKRPLYSPTFSSQRHTA